MPIKIHHGPPGSFKSSGAMADDFLREARAGRVIVTNVRGVTRQRTLKEFPDLPDTFDVINVSDQTEEGRLKWAKWFHWAPKGAFIFVDEIQDIWPKSWRESDLRALDYPGGVEQAAADDRPKDWAQAWDKHRHWNWDIVATCPAYSKVRDDIKSVADAAYKHKDLALIGWTGRYIEAMHLADDTGKNASDFLNIEKKKVPPYVFRLYDSTATGQHRTNANGFNLFKNPRVAILLLVFAVAIYFGFGRGGITMFSGAQKPSDAPLASIAEKDTKTGGGVSSGSVPAVSSSQSALVEPFLEGESYILVSYKSKQRWRYSVSLHGATLTHTDLLDMGYTVQSLGSCALEISKEGFRRVLTCGLSEKQLAQQGEREASRSQQANASSPANESSPGILINGSEQTPTPPGPAAHLYKG